MTELRPRAASSVLVQGLILLTAALLIWAVLSFPDPAPGLGDRVYADISRSGVESPVTAVLLNFRGYDTLLEIGVLLLAALGCLALRGGRPPGPFLLVAPAGPVLSALTHVLVPLMVMVSGYLFWAGGHAPGGAFQAGAVLGAAGVLLLLGEKVRPHVLPAGLLRGLLGVGFAVFLLVAGGVMMGGRGFLEYPPAWAGSLIVFLEAVLTVSIGLTLMTLFAANPPAASPIRSSARGQEEEK